MRGNCTCCAVEYEVTGEAKLSFLCQCRQCQKITGTGHSSEFMVKEEDVFLTGKLQVYELTSDSGNSVYSNFCPICGNPIFKKTDGYPGLLFIHASTLQEPQHYHPTRVYWHVSAQPWDYVDPDLEIIQEGKRTDVTQITIPHQGESQDN